MPACVAPLGKPEKGKAASRVHRLTTRQKDCLRLVAKGYTSKEIGRQLGISYSTVDNHLLAAVQLLEVPGRAEAARKLADHEQAIRQEQLPSRPDASERHAPPPAGTVDGHSEMVGQELPRQPLPVAQTPSPADERSQVAGAPSESRPGRLLPPIGGRENVLSGSRRIYAIARISLFSTLMFVACVIVIRTCFDALR
ncbi:helix-turn-helix domain-containing protein [Sphingomonas hengshuiensis]|uniref:helix-turn-helix domain-containing protein n=1 Tax=Sphingomonas hengshuiensis TaxID=1609977 RepID=UPI001D1203A7